MKKWAFISDFDGTISKKDFYWIIIEKYYPEGEALFHQWKNGDMKDIEFLATIFGSINQTEKQTLKDIHEIPIDEHAIPFIRAVQEAGGDFYILSAGTDFYIQHILNEKELTNVQVFSNKGYFKENNVHMDIDPNEWHFSDRYGIDKSVVIQHIKESYDHVFYFGDSEPDSHPAKYADTMFAKDALIMILKEQGVPYIPVRDFKDVNRFLSEEGWLKDE
ncbi:2,3-diketo-5-methylthio-1-phosphopentane phosphatase [Salipaludibacillus keqinensis]|uniref:2,3-diketo-5-methylthio-1-phosphopentane phosphatase n=1 Tax=Salipaludibacillus keqinensis TaxID=2045207 RepID=A0A323TJV8_9BACI|nr:MtnX-like HAD-IB family phosphatase [Salipaludibacillus keqinensis]PYZ95168.1 2,3-diketo-5-methylthio-1-phosphopentane phosphatase [Salipaludibacillus keqinensis]